VVTIREAVAADAPDWARMRHALWPEESVAEHAREIARFLAGELHEPVAVLLAFDAGGLPTGFAELSIRNIVDSCSTSNVAYLEGWYVQPAVRRRGVGRALIQAAEAWARAHGCREFGSDALVENEVSAAAHLALGFEETSRVRNFRKDIA
jgi:aminoglycoside 6'-N-acetyltransferase I